MKLMLSIVLCPAGCNMEGQAHQFDVAGGSFGCAPDNNWVLPDPSRYVSSRHGFIRFENEKFLLVDESTNGIYVNGSSLPLGAGQELVLNDGDLLVFGDYRMQVNIEETTNISPSDSATKFDMPAVQGSDNKASSVLVDDLDKWLEPAAPAAQASAPVFTKIDASSSPLVSGTDAIDLGLKGEEKDPLALLGAVKTTNNGGGSSNASSGSLTDLLGESSSVDQHMMKVPSVIPDDWDDLLGGHSDNQSTNEPVQLKPAAIQSQATEPAQPDLDQTAYVAPQSSAAEDSSSEPLASLDDILSSQPEVPEQKVSEEVPKAAEDLALNELLATPSDQLTSESSNEASVGDVSAPEATKTSVSLGKPNLADKASVQMVDATSDGEALAKALGLERLSAEQQSVLNATVANTVKETVAGMMRTLRARSEIKSEFRMNMTTIQSAENNPLKFSVTPEDAIENMFAKQGKAYLSPIDAMNDGFADISDHQVALFDAMKAAYENILGQFDPDVLSRKFEKSGGKRFLGSAKGKNWDAYQELFKEYAEDNELTFKRLFGEVFADAYERRMHSLKMNRNSASSKKSR